MYTGACSALLIVIITLALIALALASPSSAKQSAFEKDNSGKDLQDLEAMLSGEHRGAGYAQDTLSNPQSNQQSNQQTNPASQFGTLYDPPYKNVFLNDTFFGNFLRELGGGPLMPQANLTWPEVLLRGPLYPNISNIAKSAGTNRHFIKPILVKEPDF